MGTTRPLLPAVLLVFGLIAGLSLQAPAPVASSTPSSAAPMQVEVLRRARLGNNTEAGTFVSSGPLKNSVVLVDGYDLLRIRVEPPERRDEDQTDDQQTRRILDLRKLPISLGPRGITYVPTEQVFALWEPLQPATLFLLDNRGQPLGATRTITYPAGFVPAHVEGLAYVPPGAPRFADRLVGIVYDATFTPRLAVMTRSGQVEAEIFPQAPLADAFLTGIAFRAPDRLLLGVDGSTDIWTIDFAGLVIGNPADGAPSRDFEAIAQASDVGRRIPQ